MITKKRKRMIKVSSVKDDIPVLKEGCSYVVIDGVKIDREKFFTLKDLMPHLNNEERGKIGKQVSRTFMTFNKGISPLKIKESVCDGVEAEVYLYPKVMQSTFNFLDFVKYRFCK